VDLSEVIARDEDALESMTRFVTIILIRMRIGVMKMKIGSRIELLFFQCHH